jgi:Domain of unknown function (DUF4262)
MCLECDGYSRDEVLQAFDLHIRVHGWTLVQVQGDGETWCYTIGLTESFDHPELVLIDVELDRQPALVQRLVDVIQREGTLPYEHLLSLGLGVVDVHADHLTSDLFGMWAARYDRYPEPGEMIQVVLAADGCCPFHSTATRRLDEPGSRPPAPTPFPGPNRATRRAKRRR